MVLVSCIGDRGEPGGFVGRIFWGGGFLAGRGWFFGGRSSGLRPSPRGLAPKSFVDYSQR